MPRIPILLAFPLLSACMTSPAEDVTRASGPPAAMAGTCKAAAVTPAVLETVTEQVLEVPAMVTPDGTVLRPARYRSATSTRIVTPRETTWFETPCPLKRRDPDFIMQIQRALQVRGLYSGEISGSYDRETQTAVAAFQSGQDLESGELSSKSAESLGLIVLERDG